MATSTLGPYAKIIALTEGMINRGLKDLHQTYKSYLSKISYSDEKLGLIELDLKAPQLLIKSEQDVYFQFNIEFGSLTTTSPPRAISLEGWTITHPLSKQALLNFAGPFGDGTTHISNLAIERIFETLVNSANDGFRPDDVLSVRNSKEDSKNGRTLRWHEWRQQCPEDWSWTKTVLEELPKKYKSEGYSAIGYMITLPAPPELGLRRFYVGTEKEDRFILDFVSANQSHGENKQAPQFNSLLISGQTSDSSPSALTFANAMYCTNYVSQTMGKVTTEVQSGLWTINCRDVLEDLVLPRLRVINEASVLKTGPAVWIPSGNGSKQYKPLIQLAKDFASPGDDFKPKKDYTFTKGTDANGSAQFSWSWHMDVPEIQTNDVLPATGRSHKYQTSSSSNAVASWSQTLSENLIRLDYTVKYTVISTWASSAAWEKATAKAQYTYLLKYFFFVCFDIVEGQIKITLNGMPHKTTTKEEGAFTLELIDEVSFGRVEDYELDYYVTLEDYIKTNLIESIKEASRKLQDQFQTEMVFSLEPESAWLDFTTKPSFNVLGDLVVGIQYKSPQFISGFLKAFVPRPKTPEKPKPKPRPEPPRPTTKLLWTYSFIQDLEDEETGILELVAKNNFDQIAINIGYFIVTVISGSTTPSPAKEGEEDRIVPALFSAHTLKASNVEIGDPFSESSVTVSQSKTDKQRWDIRITPEAGEDEDPELAAFRLQGGDAVAIKVQARCDPEKWTKSDKTAIIGETCVKEAWKDEEDLTSYTGSGEMVIGVKAKLQVD